MIKFIDPRGEVATAIDPYCLSKDVRTEEGKGITVALLANGFPDSELFLRKVGLAIQSRLPNALTLFWNKGNAGIAITDEMLEQVISQCDVAVAGYGH
ncbi:MAG TPA: hypothetical protein DD440_01600 [Porticoccaceae bacterium]|nr:hypothetical protein [Porticoccaceae bacterium]|tara:strand:+ start:105 stop:398 length:294 start_codon:yes stop_codon:yes gene_type:complete